MQDRVTIGVPIYRGERFLEETLHCIQRQTYKAFDVIMSLDGPDPVCASICEKFLGDPRFKLVVQPKRLGWVGHLNWLMARVTNAFWYFHQQDDLTEDTYLEVLMDHAARHPAAALVYCDIRPIGRIEGTTFSAPSVLGATAYTRTMTMLQEHFPAFAFRGLTRAEALREAGPIPSNAANNFGVDITWLTAVARSGELHRVPLTLYSKRYHDRNTESGWWTLPKGDQLHAWRCHCVDMLGKAILLTGSPQQARLLWFAVVARLTVPEAANHFLRTDELEQADRVGLLNAFLDQAQETFLEVVPIWLDASWDHIRHWTTASFWLPNRTPVTIIRFGPTPVTRGESFNLQPDGSSALWVETDRPAPPGTRIRLGTTDLQTVLSGCLLTAPVLAALTDCPASLPLQLVGPDSSPRSNIEIFRVMDRNSETIGDAS